MAQALFNIFIYISLTYVCLPVLYYKQAMRKWLIENTGEKIVLAIVILVSTIILQMLSGGLIKLMDSLVEPSGWHLTRHTYVAWIFLGCVYYFICSMLISFLAEKFLNVHKKTALPEDDSTHE
jgi:phosphotransferase system  glucose/maltose/N-acetylglucosamine-specific IIC component